jgi:hypothetical protein
LHGEGDESGQVCSPATQKITPRPDYGGARQPGNGGEGQNGVAGGFGMMWFGEKHLHAYRHDRHAHGREGGGGGRDQDGVATGSVGGAEAAVGVRRPVRLALQQLFRREPGRGREGESVQRLRGGGWGVRVR